MPASSLGDRTVVTSRRTDKSITPPVVEIDDHHESRLKRLNLLMAFVHTILAVVTAVSTRNFDLRAPVFRVVITINYTLNHAENVEMLRKSNASDLFDVKMEPLSSGLPIAWLTLAFFVFTAIAHLCAAVVYPAMYFSFIKRKCNPFRWVEYSLTASLMWLVLAQAFAFVDANALALSTAMIALTMASGLQCEYVARPVDSFTWSVPLTHRLLFLLPGTLLYATASVTLLVALFGGVSGTLPNFVLPMVLGQLALFESFAAVILWQQCRPPSMWIYGEYANQWLSLFSKALLGIVLIANVLIYEEYECVLDDTVC